jgi:hypothetical protein
VHPNARLDDGDKNALKPGLLSKLADTEPEHAAKKLLEPHGKTPRTGLPGPCVNLSWIAGTRT